MLSHGGWVVGVLSVCCAFLAAFITSSYLSDAVLSSDFFHFLVVFLIIYYLIYWTTKKLHPESVHWNAVLWFGTLSIGLLVILIVAALGLSCIFWALSPPAQPVPTFTERRFINYSGYGFSTKYPAGMVLQEFPGKWNTFTSTKDDYVDEGAIFCRDPIDIEEGVSWENYTTIDILWTNTTSKPYKEAMLQAYEALGDNVTTSNVTIGTPEVVEHLGHRVGSLSVEYDYYSHHSYARISWWHCALGTGNRTYATCVSSSSQEWASNLSAEIVGSFMCHDPNLTRLNLPL